MRFQKIFRFTLGSRILAIKVNAWNQELHTHYGITNETPDKMYIPFWDFNESISIEEIIGELQYIVSKFGLSDTFIIQTYPKQSYRAFSFTKVTFNNFIAILSSTQFIDSSYLKHSVMRGRAVIRISNKDGTENKLIYKIDGYKYGIESNHHRAFLSSMYPGIPKAFHPPEKVKVRLSKYESFR